MYAIILDKSALDSQALIGHLANWQQTHKLRAEQFELNSHQEIRELMRSKGGEFSNIVVIGEQQSFEWVVAEIQAVSEKAVLSYIPTSNNLLAKRFGIKDYKEGFTALMQRKIVELVAVSINDQFFLFNFNLHSHTVGDFKAQIDIDAKLKLSLSTNKIVFHNRNQELTPHNSSILIETFVRYKPPAEGENSLKIPPSVLGRSQAKQEELQLRLPANKIRIQASSTLLSGSNIALKNPLSIGKHQRAVRVIVKKGQESQTILAPGLK